MERGPVGMDELVEHWTVLREERDLVDAKHGATRLGFALILKFYTRHGRLPRGRGEFPPEVVEHVAKQTKSETADFGRYDWTGRTAERHRQEIRGHLGFRECSVADADKLTDWLAANVAHAERDPGAVRDYGTSDTAMAVSFTVAAVGLARLAWLATVRSPAPRRAGPPGTRKVIPGQQDRRWRGRCP